jgi:hypothetical protein
VKRKERVGSGTDHGWFVQVELLKLEKSWKKAVSFPMSL